MPSALYPPRGRGRRRDPDIDGKILDAGLTAYAELGWAATTMDEVARRAGVGKSALYRRYASKREIIVAALTAASPHFEPADTDLSPRELLIAIGSRMRVQYGGRFGRAMVQLALDAEKEPEVFAEVYRDFYREMAFGLDALNAAAVPEERLDLGGKTGLAIIEAVAGAILMRTLFTAGWDDPRVEAPDDEFVAGIVDLLLASFASRG